MATRALFFTKKTLRKSGFDHYLYDQCTGCVVSTVPVLENSYNDPRVNTDTLWVKTLCN